MSPGTSEGRPAGTGTASESLNVLTNTDSLVQIPAIFPRCHRESSHFRRMRRPRAVYIAGCRRARSTVEGQQ